MNTSLSPDVRVLLLGGMRNLIHITRKTRKHAQAKNIDEAVFMQGRLAPDMFNFVQQVQYVCFLAIEIMGPLSGKPAPELEYDEVTTDDCIRSLKRTIVYIESISARDIARTKVKSIAVFWNKKQRFTPAAYLEKVGIPDFFFHLTIAYGILRHLGVPLGKDDFLGKL